MKKTLLILGICLATVLWSPSAKAIGLDNGSSAANAVDHSVGSFHGFRVNLDASFDPSIGHENNFYKWSVFSVDGGTETPLTNFNNFQFVSYNPKGADFSAKYGANIGTAGVHSSQNLYSIGIQWLDVLAAGVYIVEVEEYNSIDASSCSSRRRFYINVTTGGVDFTIAALNPEDDVVFNGSAGQTLTACNTFSGGLVKNDASHVLGSSSVFYKISMKTGSQAWNGAWGFDYVLANNNGTGLAIEVLTGVSGASAGTANITDKEIRVDANNPVAYLKLTFTNVLGTPADADITFNLKETNSEVLVGNTTAFITTTTSPQFESFEKKAGNAVATSFVITASPDVQAISVE